MQFIAELAACKAREAPPMMRFQHVLGLATALDKDDRHLLRTGGRSFTGLVEGEHSRV